MTCAQKFDQTDILEQNSLICGIPPTMNIADNLEDVHNPKIIQHTIYSHGHMLTGSQGHVMCSYVVTQDSVTSILSGRIRIQCQECIVFEIVLLLMNYFINANLLNDIIGVSCVSC